MSDDFLSFHTAALDEVTAFVGSPFTYGGAVYNGVINALELSNELKEGGLVEVLGTQVIVAKTQLRSSPTAGQTLYIGGQKARIVRVESDEVSYEMTCVSATH